MICHKQKIIFIHIPKCAGSSIQCFHFGGKYLNWRIPNYEVLHGYCPLRKLHLQHATPRQLIETGLIEKSIWDSYFKFSFVRNPWDRAYSDYMWILKDTKIQGTFEEYITKSGPFEEVLNSADTYLFRGDHLLPQTDFIELDGDLKLDFVGRFESFKEDIIKLNRILSITREFNEHENRNPHRLASYSLFYTEANRKRVEKLYEKDIQQFAYSFDL